MSKVILSFFLLMVLQSLTIEGISKRSKEEVVDCGPGLFQDERGECVVHEKRWHVFGKCYPGYLRDESGQCVAWNVYHRH
ncbi:UNVERIFIED_CONTAM: hypothetical protein PYX00_003940 [Menopon gallinae]|uniref:Uncharacterized protein n=1 Tax=Menopon gallinae TaxID=328185 RepID=A0AAW2I3W4_9NEOP